MPCSDQASEKTTGSGFRTTGNIQGLSASFWKTIFFFYAVYCLLALALRAA